MTGMGKESWSSERWGVLLALTPRSKAVKQREQGRSHMGKLLLSQLISNFQGPWICQIMEHSELEGIH